jgi:hypothetical protein
MADVKTAVVISDTKADVKTDWRQAIKIYPHCTEDECNKKCLIEGTCKFLPEFEKFRNEYADDLYDYVETIGSVFLTTEEDVNIFKKYVFAGGLAHYIKSDAEAAYNYFQGCRFLIIMSSNK